MARADPSPQPRCAREETGAVKCPRDAAGRLLPIPALERFAAKCEFDPYTGCVLWRGGTTQGRANTAIYGSFWDGDRRWFAHRWAAAHIHGHDITGLQVGHVCPGAPNTLCVQHVIPQTLQENMAEQIERLGPPGTRNRGLQTNDQRQFWLFVHLGLEQLPPTPAAPGTPADVPWYDPPAWFAPFVPKPEVTACPF